MKKILAAYEKVEDVVASIGLICGVGIMFIGVVFRYVLKHPLTFVDEIAPIFIVWSTLAGYSIALRKDEHIKMDILYSAVKSPAARRIIDAFSYVCGILFSLFMAVYGYKAMQMQHAMHRVTQILEVPVWITYLIIPFIGVILVVRYIHLLVQLFRDRPGENTQESQEG